MGSPSSDGTAAGLALGAVGTAGAAAFHAFVFFFGGTAGGRSAKHVLAAGRVENAIGGAASLVALVGGFGLVHLLARASPPTSRAPRRAAALFALAGIVALVVAGRA